LKTSNIVQKLWNYCKILRNDGMSHDDNVGQLTCLLFLNMADERSRPPYNRPSPVSEAYAWFSLIKKDGDDLFGHYRHTLDA
jgi:type I restriction enzyme M protein